MINLYLNERCVEDVTVIDLKGRERVRGVTVGLYNSIRCLADEGKTQILLDLAWVKHIDSIGLGELISSHVTLDDKGGALKLMHMSESIHATAPSAAGAGLMRCSGISIRRQKYISTPVSQIWKTTRASIA